MSGKTARQWLFSEVFRSLETAAAIPRNTPIPKGQTLQHRPSRRSETPEIPSPQGAEIPPDDPGFTPGRPASRKLDFQRVTSELESASAPPADPAYLGSKKLPVKTRFRNFPKLTNNLERPLAASVGGICAPETIRSSALFEEGG